MESKRFILYAMGLMGIVSIGLASAQEERSREREEGRREARDEKPGDNDSIVRMRGPIHEAFASPTVAKPSPGPIVAEKPPELIEEMTPPAPPAVDGDEPEWVPGYWAWDDDKTGYLWVSGTWRFAPPETRWLPGYWANAEDGYRWVAGAWISIKEEHIDYLPQPPEPKVEEVPKVVEGDSRVWIPGNWYYENNDYVWQSGYWANSNENWIWVPANYLWSPRGYIYVAGYWDYIIPNRGVLFAPAAIDYRAGFRGRYTPSVIIDVPRVLAHWFVRPSYYHYYFGDYYSDQYTRAGYIPWVSYTRTRGYFDPLYSWYSVRSPQILRDVTRSHSYFVSHTDGRPPVAYAEYRQFATRAGNASVTTGIQFAKPVSEMRWSTRSGEASTRLGDSTRGFRDLATRRFENEVRDRIRDGADRNDASRDRLPDAGKSRTDRTRDTDRMDRDGRTDSNRDGRTDRTTDRNEGRDRTGRTDRTDKTDRTGRTDKDTRTDRTERTDRMERTDRTDKGSTPPNRDRTDTDRAGRSGLPDRTDRQNDPAKRAGEAANKAKEATRRGESFTLPRVNRNPNSGTDATKQTRRTPPAAPNRPSTDPGRRSSTTPDPSRTGGTPPAGRTPPNPGGNPASGGKGSTAPPPQGGKPNPPKGG